MDTRLVITRFDWVTQLATCDQEAKCSVSAEFFSFFFFFRFCFVFFFFFFFFFFFSFVVFTAMLNV